MNLSLRRPGFLAQASLVLALLAAASAGTAQAQAPVPPTNGSTPSPTAHRLIYTLTEKDGNKTLGAQHFTVTTLAEKSSQINVGSRVPYSPGPKNDLGRQYSYSDVGLSIHVFAREFSNGLQINSTIEQSSFAPAADDQSAPPVIRQTKLESNALLTPGKPVQLGSFDVPGSTRHYEVELVLEPVR